MKKMTALMLCVILVITSITMVFAETTMTYEVPETDADYYYNTTFTEKPSGNWSGGPTGNVATGTWATNGTYDAETGAMVLTGKYMQNDFQTADEAPVAAPITAKGSYIIEADLYFPSVENLSEWTLYLAAAAKNYALRPFQISGGEFSFNGVKTGVAVEKETWYTVRLMVSMNDGGVCTGITGEVVNAETGKVVASKASWGASSIATGVYGVRLAIRTATTNNTVHTRRWSFFKSGASSTVVPEKPVIIGGDANPTIEGDVYPLTDSGYYYKETFTARPNVAWEAKSLEVAAASGTITAKSGKANYDADYNGLLVDGFIAANVTGDAISNPGEYILEADYLASPNPIADDNDILRISLDSKYPVIIANDGTVQFNGQDSDFAVVTNRWYTIRLALTLPSGSITAKVIDKATGKVEAEQTWASGLTSISKYQVAPKTASTKMYTQNWKFFKNNLGSAVDLWEIVGDLDEAAALPCAVFQDASGKELTKIQTGTVKVVPTIVKGEENESGIFMAAVYGADGCLKRISMQTVYAEGEDYILWSPRAAIDITVDSTDDYIKCFFWNSTSTMEPKMISAGL
ncbi:MAG: hypothetical protein U0L92_01430 [Clostridia bacterium]|nr:hypothetical protein [Clostridia bacterium]